MSLFLKLINPFVNTRIFDPKKIILKIKTMKLFLYTDGGSRQNPGPAATGAVVKNEKGEIIAESTTFLGKATNNIAEYKALIEGLALALDLKPEKITCYLDSKLVVEQSLGHWKIKETTLRPLVANIQKTLLENPNIELHHIPREKNKDADSLVNQTLDAHTT